MNSAKRLAAVGFAAWIVSPVSGAATLTFPGVAPCDAGLQACIDGAAAGDVILVATNATIAESLDVDKSLTLRPAAGFDPLLDGFVALGSGDLEPATIDFSGFRLDGGLRASPGEADLNVRITGNRITAASGFARGLRIDSGTFPPYGNVVAEVRDNVIDITGDGRSAQCAGIEASGVGDTGTSVVTVAGNRVTVSDCGQGEGIAVRNGFGEFMRADVIGNRVAAPGTTNGILVTATAGSPAAGLQVRVINNVVTGQEDIAGAVGGLVVSASGEDTRISAQIINNTVVANETGLRVDARVDLGATVDALVANNLVAFNSDGGLSIGEDELPTVANRGNLVFGNGRDAFTPGLGTVFADPRLVGGGDLRLLAGSPAINAGSDSAVPGDIVVDLDGASRVVGGRVDIGAFEDPQGIGGVPPIPTLGGWALLVLGLVTGVIGAWARFQAKTRK